MSFSVDGHKMAVSATDNKIRIFNFATGRLSKVIDESISKMSDEQKAQVFYIFELICLILLILLNYIITNFYV